MKAFRIFLFLLPVFLLTMLAACGGGGGGEGPPNVQLSITPFQVDLDGGQTQQFTATVTGSTNKTVTWKVSGTNCAGSACGTIDTNGLYAAPSSIANDLAVKISATSQANTGVTVSSTVNLKAVAVNANPKTMSVEAGDAYTVTASVTHTTNTAVTWSLSGTGCTGAACGTLSNAGLYTAPSLIANSATVVVKATSVADTTKFDTCTVTLLPIVVKITPATSNLDGGQSLQFTATVENHDNKAVTWSASGTGSITNGGLFTAPMIISSQSTATVYVTSVADPTKSASAVITLWPIAIAIAPTTATLGGGETKQFTVTVTHHANKAVNWSLTGLGDLDTTGLYQAPAVIAAQSTSTVKVTSAMDPSKSASAVVTLIPISVTVSPATATVALSGTQQFTATVAGTANKSVTWSVSGTGCSGSECGTVSSTGLYTAPTSAPSPPTVTVKATSAQDVTKSGAATVSLTQNLKSRLKGQYAFWTQGFDAAGKMFATTGTFTADGNGTITGGYRDSTSVGGSSHQRNPLAGDYDVLPDGRGTITFVFWDDFAEFRFVLDATGNEMQLNQFDDTGVHSAGIAKKQTISDFLLSKITGDYAFAMTGTGLYGERNGVLGHMHSNGAGVISAGTLDTKMAGEAAILGVPFTGTMAMDGTYGTSAGRGTITLSASGQTLHAGFYMVNAQEAFFLVTDTVTANMPLLSGRLLKQSGGPYTEASWKGACAYYMTGTVGNPQASAVLVGYIEPDGVTTLYVEYARNHAGFITEFGNGSADYEIDAGGSGIFTSNTYGDFVFVMTGLNRGFLMGIAGLDEVHVGWFEPQVVPTGGFKTATFSGDFPLATSEMAASSAVTMTGTMTWNGGAGVGGVLDASGTPGNVGDQVVAGTYAITGSGPRSGNGRGVVQLTQPGGSKFIFYPVSDSKVFMVNVDPNNHGASALVLKK